MLYDKGKMKDDNGNLYFSGWINKLKSMFYPPGYFPGMKTKLFFHWLSLEDSKEGVPEVFIT